MATILLHLAFSVIIPEQNVARNKTLSSHSYESISRRASFAMAAAIVTR
jgi:hypothetical protein